MNSLSLCSSKANLVESVMPTTRDRFQGKDKKNQKLSYPEWQSKLSNKIQKPKELWYVCGKSGHNAYQYPLRKGQLQPNRKPVTQANFAEDTEVTCVVVEEASRKQR